MRKSHKTDLESKIAKNTEMFSETEFYMSRRSFTIFFDLTRKVFGSHLRDHSTFIP